MKNILFVEEPFLLRFLRKSKFFYVRNGFKLNFVKSQMGDIQKGNDIIYQLITQSLQTSNKNGLMCSKMGTVELENFCALQSLLSVQNNKGILIKDFLCLQKFKKLRCEKVFSQVSY